MVAATLMNRSFDLILNHHPRLLNHPTNNCRDTFILKPTHPKPKRSPLSSQSIITSKIYSWPQKITNYIQLPTQDHLKDAPRLSPGLRSGPQPRHQAPAGDQRPWQHRQRQLRRLRTRGALRRFLPEGEDANQRYLQRGPHGAKGRTGCLNWDGH